MENQLIYMLKNIVILVQNQVRDAIIFVSILLNLLIYQRIHSSFKKFEILH